MADKVIIFSRIFKIGFEMIRVNFRHPRGVVRKSPVSDTLILLNFWPSFWWTLVESGCAYLFASTYVWNKVEPSISSCGCDFVTSVCVSIRDTIVEPSERFSEKY